MDLMEKILELSQLGYSCSQIIVRLALEMRGEDNPALVAAVSGLAGGVGGRGHNCGCLTGGACALSLFTGRGDDGSAAHPEHKAALAELVTWFEELMGENYGSIDCAAVLQGDPSRKLECCPPIIAETFAKCMEILSEREIIE